jgi:thiamine biosynthesis lipoprotein
MSSTPSSTSFPALGGTAVVAAVDARRIAAARDAVELTVAQLDEACSRFREDSELSALNAQAGSWVRVSPMLLDAVSASLRAARLTGGDVDPTVGRAMIALGYDRDFESLGGAVAAVAMASVPGWRSVSVDPAHSTIRLEPGVMLDLGATAKALGADLAASRAAQVAGCGVLVGLSGDIALAGKPPEGGWRIRVTDDHRSGPEAPGQTISVRSGGVATSSVMSRRWRIDGGGGTAHHLIDPRTARPACGEWRTVSVAAATCLDANIASTAAIVRGASAVEWLGELCLPSRLVSGGGTVRHIAGWPTDGDDLATFGAEPVKASSR